MKQTRRDLLALVPAVAVTATIPGQALANDNALEAAWQRKVEALDAFDLIHVNGDTPDETTIWNVVDEADDFIRSATANTPHGLSIQLWGALGHCVETKEQDEACKCRDLDALAALETGMEAPAGYILAALRSLRSMGS